METHFFDESKYMKREKLQSLCYEIFAKTTTKKARSLEKKLNEAHAKDEKLTQVEYNKLYEVFMVQLYIDYIYAANRRLSLEDAKHFLDTQMFILFIYSESKQVIEHIKKLKGRELTQEEYDIMYDMTQEFTRTGQMPHFPGDAGHGGPMDH